MLSFREADILSTMEARQNQATRIQAKKLLADIARKHHVYEHNFEVIEVGDHTYDGILQVVYDAKYIAGSRETMEDPGESSFHEISILNYIILPGDIDEDGETIYDMEKIKLITMDIESAIDDSMIDQDIQDTLSERDNTPEPPDRDGDY